MAKAKPNESVSSPQEYRDILKQVELEEISLEECSASVRRDRFGKPVNVSIKNESKSHQWEGDFVVIEHRYELLASSGTKRDYALKIICMYRLKYSSKTSLSEDFLELFRTRNVPLNSWPYFREFVQSTTQRMNIPPLTLPLLK